MAEIRQYRVTEYAVSYFAGISPHVSDTEAVVASIRLYAADGQHRGTVHFQPDGVAKLKEAAYNEQTGEITLYYSASMVYTVIDILRNEEPISIRYVSPRAAGIFTDKEPIGEGE